MEPGAAGDADASVFFSNGGCAMAKGSWFSRLFGNTSASRDTKPPDRAAMVRAQALATKWWLSDEAKHSGETRTCDGCKRAVRVGEGCLCRPRLADMVDTSRDQIAVCVSPKCVCESCFVKMAFQPWADELPEALAMLVVGVEMALVDGPLTEREEVWLKAHAAAWGASGEELMEMIHERMGNKFAGRKCTSLEGSALELLKPYLRTVIESLTAIAAVDSDTCLMAPIELVFVTKTGEALGLSIEQALEMVSAPYRSENQVTP